MAQALRLISRLELFAACATSSIVDPPADSAHVPKHADHYGQSSFRPKIGSGSLILSPHRDVHQYSVISSPEDFPRQTAVDTFHKFQPSVKRSFFGSGCASPRNELRMSEKQFRPWLRRAKKMSLMPAGQRGPGGQDRRLEHDRCTSSALFSFDAPFGVFGSFPSLVKAQEDTRLGSRCLNTEQ